MVDKDRITVYGSRDCDETRGTCGIDTSVHENSWEGTKIRTEIVLVSKEYIEEEDAQDGVEEKVEEETVFRFPVSASGKKPVQVAMFG